jgi:hypothetical protein
MKLWLERALAVIRWGWEKLVAFAKVVWSVLRATFDTVYDPPPKTIRFWFWSFTALVAVVWLTFAFTNSWFYRPTVEFFATLGDDGDVFLPDHMEPLPSVATPAVPVPSVEVACHDMSDTPQCEPVLPPESGSGGKVEVSDIPPPVAKPPVGYKAKKSPAGYKRRKHQPYQTYWGF